MFAPLLHSTIFLAANSILMNVEKRMNMTKPTESFQQLPMEERIKISYQNLERMRRPNGGYVASLYWDERRHFFIKALDYFSRLENCMTPEGMAPEMYVGGKPGHNTPLAWAQSLHTIAAQILLNLAQGHPSHFKIPAHLRSGKL